MTNNFKGTYIGTNPAHHLSSAFRFRGDTCCFSSLYQKVINNEFDYMGEKSEDTVDGFIENRMIELNNQNGCVGEIVRVGKAVGYMGYYLSVDGDDIGSETSADLLKRTLFNLAYRTHLNSRYAIIKVTNDNISYIKGYDDFETAKSMVFSLINPLIDDCDYDSIYYIRDFKTDKYHKCSLITSENPTCTTTEKTTNTQIILPMYQYICYGHI